MSSHSKQTEQFKAAVRELRAIPNTSKGLDIVERYAGHLRQERSTLLQQLRSLEEEQARLRPLVGIPARIGELEAEVEQLRKSRQEADDFRRRAAALEQELRKNKAVARREGIEYCFASICPTHSDADLWVTLGGLMQVRMSGDSAVTCIISGFDEDPREVWDIPEVQNLCQRLVDMGFLAVLYPATFCPLLAEPLADCPSSLGGFEVWVIAQGLTPQGQVTAECFEEYLREFKASGERMNSPEWVCVGREHPAPHKPRSKAQK